MAPDQGATQITAAVTDFGVLVLGDGFALSFRERLRVARCRHYLNATSSISPSALIAPGVELLLSFR